MVDDNMWREWINNLQAEDLPEDGVVSSDIEHVSKKKIKGIKEPEQVLFLQKVVTEVYVFTDMENKSFGQHTFQDLFILGEMSASKVLRILEREKRKRERRDDE
jgi:hypothetical protein